MSAVSILLVATLHFDPLILAHLDCRSRVVLFGKVEFEFGRVEAGDQSVAVETGNDTVSFTIWKRSF